MKSTDKFQAARQLYNRRRALLEKADKLFEDAPSDVQDLCLAAEKADASQTIEVVPALAAE